MENIVRKKVNKKHIVNKFLLIAFIGGIVVFGIILPRPFSDHYRLSHFCAHFGMSFLISYILFSFCSRKIRLGKVMSFSLSFILAFITGSIYKYFEIVNSLPAEKIPLDKLLAITGFYTSMSENIAGILAAFTFIIYFENSLSFGNKVAALRRKGSKTA
jgi:hypothetical protein